MVDHILNYAIATLRRDQRITQLPLELRQGRSLRYDGLYHDARHQDRVGDAVLRGRPNLRAAIEKILNRKYARSVDLDTVVDLLSPHS